MSTGPGHAVDPELPELSISEAISDWHGMICGGGAGTAERKAPGECRFLSAEIDPAIGTGMLDLVSFDDDFILLAMHGSFHQPLSYRVVGEGWTRLHFRRSARVSMDFEGVGTADLRGPLCQILHQPHQVGGFEFVQGRVPLDWVTLLVRPRLLVDRFKLDTVRLSDPVRRLASGADDFLLENYSLAPEMSVAMSQLFDARFTSDLRRVHLEAKATELVCLLAGVIGERRPDGFPVRLSAFDLECLHAARATLAERCADPPGIHDLARELGINRNKLTYGFKHMFGVTISDFCFQCRMQQAWDLIRDTSLPLALVGERVGYARASAFSAAFRQQFGMTPRDARGGRLTGARAADRDPGDTFRVAGET